MAEGEGFKPPIPERGIPDFESSAIDHSANLPNVKLKNKPLSECGCKGNTKIRFHQIYMGKSCLTAIFIRKRVY